MEISAKNSVTKGGTCGPNKFQSSAVDSVQSSYSFSADDLVAYSHDLEAGIKSVTEKYE